MYDGRYQYGSVLKVPLPHFFAVPSILYTSTTCYLSTAMLNSLFPSTSSNFSKSLSISITHIMKPTISYKFVTISKLTLSTLLFDLGCAQLLKP